MGQDRLQQRPGLGGLAHPQEGPGDLLANVGRIAGVVDLLRIGAQHAAERLGGAVYIVESGADRAEHQIAPRLPARLLAESFGSPGGLVDGMPLEILRGHGLASFLAEELNELIEGPGRDRLGFECLVPELERQVHLPPMLQSHAPEQVVLGLDHLAVEAPGVDRYRRVVAAHLHQRPGQEPQRGRITLSTLEDLAGGPCRRGPVAPVVGAAALRPRVGEQARPGRQQPDPTPDESQQHRTDHNSWDPSLPLAHPRHTLVP